MSGIAVNEADSVSNSSMSDSDEEWPSFESIMKKIRRNDARVNHLDLGLERLDETFRNFTDSDWEKIGRDITNNYQLEYLDFRGLNYQVISCLFRGMTKSNSIDELRLCLRDREFSVAGLKCIMPFLQNTSCIRTLRLNGSSLGSEGFNFLIRMLHDSPIEYLWCSECGIDDAFDIDANLFPRRLKIFSLRTNNIIAPRVAKY